MHGIACRETPAQNTPKRLYTHPAIPPRQSICSPTRSNKYLFHHATCACLADSVLHSESKVSRKCEDITERQQGDESTLTPFLARSRRFKGSSIKPFKGHDTQLMIYIQKLYESQTHSQGVQTVILVPT